MKITIITATYNSEQTLSDTINSILQQNYDNYEYIIVDGASKDNTINIIKKYEPQFKGKLKWISEKDKGIYDAMNKGISLASGDVFGILNSDDFFTSNDILQTIARSFNENNVDAIYGDIHFVNNTNLNKCIRYYSSKIFKPYLMRFGLMPAHPSRYHEGWRCQYLRIIQSHINNERTFEDIKEKRCIFKCTATYAQIFL